MERKNEYQYIGSMLPNPRYVQYVQVVFFFRRFFDNLPQLIYVYQLHTFGWIFGETIFRKDVHVNTLISAFLYILKKK